MDKHETNFIALVSADEDILLIKHAEMAADQITIFEENNKESMVTMTYVVEEMLNPKLLAPDYPLDFT